MDCIADMLFFSGPVQDPDVAAFIYTSLWGSVWGMLALGQTLQ